MSISHTVITKLFIYLKTCFVFKLHFLKVEYCACNKMVEGNSFIKYFPTNKCEIE